MANAADANTRPHADTNSDEDLVVRCRRELPYVTIAFEMLVRRYEPVVYRTCRRYLKNAEEAEEATQDVFLRVFFNIAKFQGRSAFKTWLFRVTANVCASRYRSLRRIRDQAREHAEAADMKDAFEPFSGSIDFEEGPMVTALDALATPDRELLILRHLTELSFEEIAEALQVSLSAAKMRLYRAEQKLRNLLAPDRI